MIMFQTLEKAQEWVKGHGGYIVSPCIGLFIVYDTTP